jgi:transposase
LLVASQRSLTAAQMFRWCNSYLDGSFKAVVDNETFVPDSEHQEAMRRIKQLECALCRKTMENKIVKDSVGFAEAKSGMCARLY